MRLTDLAASRGRRAVTTIALIAGVGLGPVAAAHAATPLASAAASGYTAGDVVIDRVGTGSSALSSSATPVFLDEYGPAGGSSPAYTVALPTTASGPNKILTGSGTASSEGALTLSGDGQHLGLAGYAAAVGTAKVSGTAAASTPRSVGIVDASGTVDTSTSLSNFADGNNPRAAVTQNGGQAWVGGAGSSANGQGLMYAPDGASTATSLSTTAYNIRTLQIAGGQLYAAGDPTKGVSIAAVGSGLPTGSGQTVANLPFASGALPSGFSPYGFTLLTLGTGSGLDTLYVADSGNGAVEKFGLQGGSWVAEGSVGGLSGVTGLTANDVNGTVTVYATTPSALYSITDPSGQGGTLSGSPQTIATAAANTSFRGVAFAPGTTIGSGPGTPPVLPSIAPDDSSLEAAIDDPTNPTLGISVSDANYDPSQLTVTASAADPAIASQVSLSGSGARRTLTATPGTRTGETTITLTATAPDGTTSTATVTYGLSADQGDGSDRYHAGAGNASSEIAVGGGYMLVGDDNDNILRLYRQDRSGRPVNTFDFTAQLPYGTTSADIEGAARVGDVIYWLGSQSSSDTGNARPAANTLFATRVSGSGASTTLSYLGSYTGLRSDLIAWDHANGDPLGLAASASGGSKSASGLNIEGIEFAPGSSTTAYLAFRAPLEPTDNRSTALLVALTDLPSLIGAAPGSATFGAAVQFDLGGLGIREIRKNADDQYLLIAGTADGTNSPFALYTWDGRPGDSPTKTGTALPQVAGGAWEGVVSVPDPIGDGSTVELVEDNGDSDWYGTGQTSKSGLPSGLQKDLGRTFTIALPTQAITFTSTEPDPGVVGGTYAVSAQASSGDPVSYSIDPSSTDGACSLSGQTVSFTGAGTCVVDADQGGGIDAQPAPRAQQTITVAGLPSATIARPTDGATYGQGQTVDADYSCADQTNGPGIASCTDSQGVGSGNPIDTTTTGSHTFTVTASSSDGATTTQSVTYTVAALTNTTRPTITGTPRDGAKLTASTGSWSESGLAYAYQWQRCDTSGAACTPISVATKSTYVATSADVGHALTVVVTARDKGANTASATATPVGPVAAPAAPVNTTAPRITGTYAKGKALTASNGSWSSPDPLAYRYQWQRCDASGSACAAIAGATHQRYTVAAADLGGTVRVTVTATDREGQSSAQRSAAYPAPSQSS